MCTSIDVILKADNDDLKKKLKKMKLKEVSKTIIHIDEMEELILQYLEQNLDSIVNLGDYLSLEEALSAYDISKKLRPELKKFFEEKLTFYAEAYLASIDKDVIFDVFTKRTTDFISKWHKDLAKLIKVKNEECLESIFANAAKNGDSIEDIKNSLIDAYSFSRARARTIALTEMLRVHSYANYEALIQHPAVEKVKWLHSGGKGIKPRKAHVALDGVEIDKFEEFEVNGYSAKFPRDTNLPASETVHCHCTTSGVIDSDILKLSKDDKVKLMEEARKKADKLYG